MVASVMERLDQQGQQRMSEELKQISRQFDGPDSFLASGEMLLGAGSK